MVSSKRLFAPGLNRRPFCTQALPNSRVSFGRLHESGSTGGRQRRSPTGGLANGTPFHAKVPSLRELSTPMTSPKRVSRTTDLSSSWSRPFAETAEHASDNRPTAKVVQSSFLFILVP